MFNIPFNRMSSTNNTLSNKMIKEECEVNTEIAQAHTLNCQSVAKDSKNSFNPLVGLTVAKNEGTLSYSTGNNLGIEFIKCETVDKNVAIYNDEKEVSSEAGTQTIVCNNANKLNNLVDANPVSDNNFGKMTGVNREQEILCQAHTVHIVKLEVGEQSENVLTMKTEKEVVVSSENVKHDSSATLKKELKTEFDLEDFTKLNVEKKVLENAKLMGEIAINTSVDLKIESTKTDNGENNVRDQSVSAESYICTACDTIFWSFFDLTGHVGINHIVSKVDYNIPIYQCTLCGFVNLKKKCVLDHYMWKHSSERLRCICCDYVTIERSHLSHHWQAHIPKLFKCSLCSYKCSRENFLTKHLQSHHSEKKKLQCYMCGFSTELKSGLIHHMKTEHTRKEEVQFECHNCGFVTKQKSILIKHIVLQHSQKKPYRCKSCDFSTEYYQSLSRHEEALHSLAEPFKCEVCKFTSFSKGSMQRHVDVRHYKDQKFQCNTCNCVFKRESTLLRHIQRKHSKSKGYLCRYCGFKTPYKHNLRTHEVKHSQDKTFQCTLCSYKCIDKHSFEKHVVKHTKEKPFRCPSCKFKTGHKSSLIKHSLLKHSK